jgi:hypothetical protein
MPLDTGLTPASMTTFNRSERVTCPSLTRYLVDSLVRMFHTQVNALALSGILEADYGSSSLALLANYDPESFSWKMSMGFTLWGEQQSLVTLPKWGMTVSGRLFSLPILVHRMNGNDGSLWPTPQANEGLVYSFGRETALRKSRGEPRPSGKRIGASLGWEPAFLPEIEKIPDGYVSPEWKEMLMGYPCGWTDISSPHERTNHRNRKNHSGLHRKTKRTASDIKHSVTQSSLRSSIRLPSLSSHGYGRRTPKQRRPRNS